MSVGAFTDKQCPPSTQDFQASVGSKAPLWKDLANHGEEACGKPGEWKFYGKNYGWAMRFRKSGKAFLSLYPGVEALTVQIILTEEQVEQARALRLPRSVREIVEVAHPYPEGRWLFVPVRFARDAAAVKRLVGLKLKSGVAKRRKAKRAASLAR